MLRSRYLRLVSRGAGWRFAKAGAASSVAATALPAATAPSLTTARRVIPLTWVISSPPCASLLFGANIARRHAGRCHFRLRRPAVELRRGRPLRALCRLLDVAAFAGGGRHLALDAAALAGGGRDLALDLAALARGGSRPHHFLAVAAGHTHLSVLLRPARIGGPHPTGVLGLTRVLGLARGDAAFLPRWCGRVGECGEQVRDALDQMLASVEHFALTYRPLRSDRLAERIFSFDHLDTRRLAMIPFGAVVDAVGTNDAVLGGDPVPELRLRAAGRANSVHVHGQAVGMQGIELVAEAADPKRRRP